jgi:hypothetical protein
VSHHGKSVLLALLATATLVVEPSSAAGLDPEAREQRRQELRRQLEAERERWRAEGHAGGHRRHAGPHGFAAPGPGAGPPGGYPAGSPYGAGGARLSPEERRSLRDTLREHRP